MEFRQDRHHPWAGDPFCVDVLVLYPELRLALWGQAGSLAGTIDNQLILIEEVHEKRQNFLRLGHCSISREMRLAVNQVEVR
jgi:hypothetical protein